MLPDINSKSHKAQYGTPLMAETLLAVPL